MHYQLTQLLILGWYIINYTESIFIYNLTNTNKLLCHACKGSNCEKINTDDDNMIVCSKDVQLCWAGFVDQQPYRTCASRYCTPSGISLDSDIRIETCCHSNLCNSIPLSWSAWSKLDKKTPARRSETSTAKTPEITTKRPTPKKRPTTERIYFVDEIADGEKVPLYKEFDGGQGDTPLSRLYFNASNPATFGITWDRVPYEKDFSHRVASISKLLILIMPVLIVLLF